MDKHSRNLREVDVTYEGETKNAEPLRQHLLSFYETDVFNAPTRNCYRVTVKARNKFGTTVETVRAGRLGTDGCN